MNDSVCKSSSYDWGFQKRVYRSISLFHFFISLAIFLQWKTWFDLTLSWLTKMVKWVFLFVFCVIDCYIWLNQVIIIWNKMKWEWGKSPFGVFFCFICFWVFFFANTHFIHILAIINANHIEYFVLITLSIRDFQKTLNLSLKFFPKYLWMWGPREASAFQSHRDITGSIMQP